MSELRNRWIVRVVLAFAVVAFVGVSIIPILTAMNKPQSSPQNQANGDHKISLSEQK